MNADLSWSEVRWRDPLSHQPANDPAMTAPKIARNRSFDMEFREDQTAWHSKPYMQGDNEIHAPVARTGSQASQRLLNHTNLTTKLRESPEGARNRSHGLQNSQCLIRRTSDETRTGSASGQLDRQLESDHRLTEHSNSLGTTISKDQPRVHDDYETSRDGDHTSATDARVSPQEQATSLPSFAFFQRSASCTGGSLADPRNGISPGKTSCRGCVERDSSIEDIAIAVSGIEEVLRLRQSESIIKNPDGLLADFSSTARWVIDRLREVKLKVRLQNSQPNVTGGYGYRSHQAFENPPSILTRSLTPPSSVKRQSDCPEVDDLQTNKRLKTSPLNNHHPELNPTFKYLEDQRRASESAQRNEPHRTYSPSHSDSWVASTRPQQQSPGLTGRSLRPLPSPSSLANTSHKAPWSGSIAPSGSSPTISHRAPSSIHNASVSSAASQHIADLQHQITVKSLGLQTLQSEYTSLLQKFQRDRLRNQTLEKKAVAADQEVNELFSRNEELAEQVKTLETQAEQQEKRREAERSEALRQKDQWGKMLEMSGRLQAKNADERQKLAKEKDDLLQRLMILENDAALGARKPAGPLRETAQSHEHGSRHAEKSAEESNALLVSLQRDNDLLQARSAMLRTALERVQSQFTGIMDMRRATLEREAQIPAGIAMVLQEDNDAHISRIDQGQSQHLEPHDPLRREVQRHSAECSPQQRLSSGDALLDSESTKHPLAQEQSLPPSTISRDGRTPTISLTKPLHEANPPTAKDKSPSRPKAVQLPKWQPPNTTALRMGSEPLANNQRRASGPSTPYPGSDPHIPQWQPANSTTSSPPSIQAKASSPPQSLMPAFAADKTPAHHYTPQYVAPSPQIGGSTAEKPDASASMPPPPRPGLASTSWRAS